MSGGHASVLVDRWFGVRLFLTRAWMLLACTLLAAYVLAPLVVAAYSGSWNQAAAYAGCLGVLLCVVGLAHPRQLAVDFECEGKALVLYLMFGRLILNPGDVHTYFGLPRRMAWCGQGGNLMRFNELIGLRVKGRRRALVLTAHNIDALVWKWLRGNCNQVEYDAFFPKPRPFVRTLAMAGVLAVFVLWMYILGTHGIIQARTLR
jgi:hypothetical protein